MLKNEAAATTVMQMPVSRCLFPERHQIGFVVFIVGDTCTDRYSSLYDALCAAGHYRDKWKSILKFLISIVEKFVLLSILLCEITMEIYFFVTASCAAIAF